MKTILETLLAKATAEHAKFFAAMQDPTINAESAAIFATAAIRFAAIRDYLETRLEAY